MTIWFSASCSFTSLPNSVGLAALPLRSAAFFVCALSVSDAIFLILELAPSFEGLLQVSSALKADKPDTLQALITKTGLQPEEADMWARAADNMYVPFDAATGIYPQDDGFLDRQPWDFEDTPADRYPLLLSIP